MKYNEVISRQRRDAAISGLGLTTAEQMAYMASETFRRQAQQRYDAEHDEQSQSVAPQSAQAEPAPARSWALWILGAVALGGAVLLWKGRH